MMQITFRREHGNIMIDGFPVPFNGRWVARDENGNYMGHDRYRNDLSDRLADLGTIVIEGN